MRPLRFLLSVGLVAVAASAGPGGAASPTGPSACKPGSTRAVIAGRTTCLRAGQACRRRLDRQYHRYGFHCHGGALSRARPPDRTPPGAPTVVGPRQTEETRPVFAFSALDSRTPPDRIRFRCAFDQLELRACPSQHSEPLSLGRHLLRVQALDLAGNESAVTEHVVDVLGAWNPVADFRFAPNQANPTPDRYGFSTWSYLWSPTRQHDPAQYLPFAHFTALEPQRGQWDSGDSHGTPFVPWPLVGANANVIVMHPGNGQFAILAWRSPVAASLEFTGSVHLLGPCSNGVLWSVDLGSSTLLDGALAAGVGQRVAGTVRVAAGDTLFFIVDPGGDDLCDTTSLTLLIRTTGY